MLTASGYDEARLVVVRSGFPVSAGPARARALTFPAHASKPGRRHHDRHECVGARQGAPQQIGTNSVGSQASGAAGCGRVQPTLTGSGQGCSVRRRGSPVPDLHRVHLDNSDRRSRPDQEHHEHRP